MVATSSGVGEHRAGAARDSGLHVRDLLEDPHVNHNCITSIKKSRKKSAKPTDPIEIPTQQVLAKQPEDDQEVSIQFTEDGQERNVQGIIKEVTDDADGSVKVTVKAGQRDTTVSDASIGHMSIKRRDTTTARTHQSIERTHNGENAKCKAIMGTIMGTME